MSEAVRWGILGAAGINEAMAPAIAGAKNARLVAIASRTADRARAAATQYGADRSVEGYEALLADADIDAVYIPLPNSLHREWVLRAVAAGKHVLCEKPMAVTAEDAREMVTAAADAGVLLGEAFMYAHHPRYTRINELVGSGAIGAVRSIITTFAFDASGDLAHSGFQGMPGSGAVYDVGCYAIHSARRILGAEPIAVTAAAQLSQRHGDIDLATSALVEFPHATLLFHVDMASSDSDTIEIIGSAGRILVPHAFLCGPGEGDFMVGGEIERVPEVNHYVAQVERFSAAVHGENGLLYADDDPVFMARALQATVRSYRLQRRVEL